jgi:hypothetical protein
MEATMRSNPRASRRARPFIAALLIIAIVPSTAFGSGSQESGTARSIIVSHGVGSHVELMLKGGERIEGTIQHIGDDRCDVVHADGQLMKIRYRDVRQVGGVTVQSHSWRPRKRDLLLIALIVVGKVSYLREECRRTSC